MVAIDGGSHPDGGSGVVVTGTLLPDTTSTAPTRLTAALHRCVARWGFAKTTVEDIAREAGMSRATAYRVFPGGKSEMFAAAAHADAARLADEVCAHVATAADLRSALIDSLLHAATFLDGHDALRFIREHEPVLLEQYLGFDGAHALLAAGGDRLGPALERFFTAHDAREVGIWLSRIVLSYTQTPSPTFDLAHRAHVEAFVDSFLLPGMPTRRDGAPPLSPDPPLHPDTH